MTVATVSSLLETLRTLHLLDSAQLAELSGHPRRFAEPQALARELIRRGWLTPFQANQLFQGKGSDLLLGSYVILDRLGGGGMGDVYRARNWKLGQLVALKVIRKDRLKNPSVVRRFHREIQTASQLNHPNIVRAFDADQVDQTHFFAMELVEGTDLTRLVKKNGPLPVAQACEVVHQAALGLQHAFEKGMVHRDIKPSNLLVAIAASPDEESHPGGLTPPGRLGTVKILDMGLARMDSADDDSESTLTKEGSVLGTVDFLAPEQALNSHNVDIRADLYSLGCTFYFLLTGKVPFPGGTATEKLLRHRLEEPAPVEKLRSELPPAVTAILRKLMAKRPEDRYQTPGELAAAIDRLRQPQLVRRWGWKISLDRIHRLPRRVIAGLLAATGFLLLILVLAVAISLSGGSGSGSARTISPATTPKDTSSRVHPVLGYVLKPHPPEAEHFNGHWYAYIPDLVPTWDEAQTRCRDMGGYLVCITSTEEQQFVANLRESKSPPRRPYCWLGGFCDASRRWNWLTGEPWHFTAWRPGQPNNGAASCLQFWDRMWHDVGQNEQKGFAAGFICEWEL